MDAKHFIQMQLASKPATNMAIEIDGKAVGGIGIILQSDIERFTAEIGYWLGEDYWNTGIMTDAVRQMSSYVFNTFLLVKIYATVFDFNIASQRVLQKAGFEREAILKYAAMKNGRLIDLHYYSLIRRDMDNYLHSF
jgi:RimJ/RimL family protein N-acetyltransferase